MICFRVTESSRRNKRRRNTSPKRANDNDRRLRQRKKNKPHLKEHRAANQSAQLYPPTSSKKRKTQPLVKLAKEEDTRELWCGDVEEQDVNSASKHGTTICCTSSSESFSASPAAACGTNICASNFSSLSTSSNVAAVSPGSVQGQFRGESTNLAFEQNCRAGARTEKLTSDNKGLDEAKWPWELDDYVSEDEGWEYKIRSDPVEDIW